MSNVAVASINTFGTTSPKGDIEPPDDPILEIHQSEMDDIVMEIANTFNIMAELVRDAGIMRGREFSRFLDQAKSSVKTEKSHLEKIKVLNAFLRKLLTRIRFTLANRPADGSKIINVLTKIQARAIQIIDYVKAVIDDDPFKRKQFSLDSQQARILFKGQSPVSVSRKETIRAMKRAEALWPALRCDHRPNDGRQTMRLTAEVQDLKDIEIANCITWQRSDRRVALSL